MFAQILSLANLNLPNHFGCLTIFTNAILNTLLCVFHLGAISSVKYMFSFSLKLTDVAVKLVSPLTSSLCLLALFCPNNQLYFCWLSLVTVLIFSTLNSAFFFNVEWMQMIVLFLSVLVLNGTVWAATAFKLLIDLRAGLFTFSYAWCLMSFGRCTNIPWKAFLWQLSLLILLRPSLCLCHCY